MAYNEVQRALAVAIVEENGGEVTAEVVALIREQLNAPGITAQSVRNWLKQKPARENFAEEKKQIFVPSTAAEFDAQQPVDSKLRHTIDLYLGILNNPGVAANTKARDAMIIVGTAIDKLLLLNKLPPEVIESVLALVEVMQRHNMDAVAVFDTMRARLEDANP